MTDRQPDRPCPPSVEAIAAIRGMPSDECWACGIDCRPERAHIVPFAVERQGGNEPEDYVLLCAVCHLNAPDVADPTCMFAWIEEMQSTHVNAMATAFRNAFHRLPASRERMSEAMWAAAQRTTTSRGRWSFATKVWVVEETARILRAERSARMSGRVGKRRPS